MRFPGVWYVCMYDVRKEKFTNLEYTHTHTHTNHVKHQHGLDLGCEGVPSTKGTFGAFLFFGAHAARVHLWFARYFLPMKHTVDGQNHAPPGMIKTL